jgi:hypothetical protein
MNNKFILTMLSEDGTVSTFHQRLNLEDVYQVLDDFRKVVIADETCDSVSIEISGFDDFYLLTGLDSEGSKTEWECT